MQGWRGEVGSNIRGLPPGKGGGVGNPHAMLAWVLLVGTERERGLGTSARTTELVTYSHQTRVPLESSVTQNTRSGVRGRETRCRRSRRLTRVGRQHNPALGSRLRREHEMRDRAHEKQTGWGLTCAPAGILGPGTRRAQTIIASGRRSGQGVGADGRAHQWACARPSQRVLPPESIQRASATRSLGRAAAFPSFRFVASPGKQIGSSRQPLDPPVPRRSYSCGEEDKRTAHVGCALA